MTSIIRDNLTVTGTFKLTSNVQVAPGVKITVMPGATLDLAGFSMLNFGTLSLQGDANTFATIQNGTYGAESDAAAFNSTYGNIKNIESDRFSDSGSLILDQSLVEKSSLSASDTTRLSNSVLIDSPFEFGTKVATVSQVTFFNSPVSVYAWISMSIGAARVPLSITDSNFLGASPVIDLNSFFSGSGLMHAVNIIKSHVHIPAGSDFEAMVYDGTDDLRVAKDLKAADFLTTPITNSSSGFVVGPYTLSLKELQTGVLKPPPPVATTQTNEISVIVDKGIVGPDAVLLKGLTETLNFSDGQLLTHTVTYGAATFDYFQIDALIMTVTRNGNFTEEFRQEIAAVAPSATSLTYTDAVALVGQASIDNVILNLAGSDGLFVS